MASAATDGCCVVTDGAAAAGPWTGLRRRPALQALMLALLATVTFGPNVRPAMAKPARHAAVAQGPRLPMKTRVAAMAASTRAVPRRPKVTTQVRKVARPTANRVRKVARSKVVTQSRRSAQLLPLVVVDAGHGGHDSGAVGPSGTLEKTVVLATAQELGRQLRATKRYRVLFTRDSDVFVTLPARVRLAVARGASLVISIHADASRDPRTRGASVYVRPAQSAGPDVVKAPAHRGAAPAIARALSESLQPSGSSKLQLVMIDSLDDDLRMVPDPARQGRFHVLGAVGIPSVLVETGFISNRADEVLLRAPKYRAKIAQAIREAVDSFFARQAPEPAERT